MYIKYTRNKYNEFTNKYLLLQLNLYRYIHISINLKKNKRYPWKQNNNVTQY